MITPQEAAKQPRDYLRNAVRILAMVRLTPISAYKAAKAVGSREQSTKRVLDTAAELGIVQVVSHTRKGAPIYTWMEKWH